MQCRALNATPVSMTCSKVSAHIAAGHAMCLVEPNGTREEGHICTTLAPKHVCLHANATVTGLLPGKLLYRNGLLHVCHLVEKCLPVGRLGNRLTNSLPKHIDTVESINVLQRIVLIVAYGPCCTH